jgi:ribosomal protein S18 acetylase RimI-like enzyme
MTGKQQILGYSTTAMFAIARQTLPVELQRGLPDPVPVALLARLAVDQQFQNQGLGRYLLVDALRRIVTASAQVAAHAIVVDAMNAAAKAFYLKYEFIELTNDPMRLFLPLETARQLKP